MQKSQVVEKKVEARIIAGRLIEKSNNQLKVQCQLRNWIQCLFYLIVYIKSDKQLAKRRDFQPRAEAGACIHSGFS